MKYKHANCHSTARRGQLLFLLAVAMLGASACGCNGTENNGAADTSMPVGEMGIPDLGADSSPDDVEPGSQPLALPTLSAPVTVRYDEAGVLHVQCETDRDCFVAQGYFHAKDRFLQMDLTRHQTFGTLSQMTGFLVGFDSDVSWRKRTLSLEGEPLEDLYFEALSETTKDIFVAYSEGVNHWLSRARAFEPDARLSEEYESGILYDVSRIPDWEPKHSLAPLFQLAYTYAGTGDVFRGFEATVLDPLVFADIHQSPAARPSSVIIESQNGFTTSPLPSAGRVAERSWLQPAAGAFRQVLESMRGTESVLFGPAIPGHGSNSWAVGGARTTSGGALLSNDPHLQITNPSIWYLVELNSKQAGGSLHIAGASIPCGPGIVIGHNEHTAWGATIAYYDLADVYVEALTPDGTGVDRGGTRIDILQKQFEFKGKDGGPPRTAIIELVPGHGPIFERDDEAGTAVTVRWVAQEPGTDVEFLPALWSATSVDEVEAALDNVRMLNVAWTAADREGSVGWYPKAAVPGRPWATTEMPAWMPLPGDGTAEWQGYLDPALLPRLKDPVAGFIATTNNDFNGSWFDGDNTNDGTDPLQQPISVGAGYRHSRAVARLRAEGPHDVGTMRAILADTHSVHGELIVPEIVTTADGLADLGPDAQAVVEALRRWRHTCPSGLDGFDPETAALSSDAAVISESSGCAAFHLLLVELTDLVFDELSAIEPGFQRTYWTASWQQTLVHLLTNPGVMSHGETFFDDAATAVIETRDEIIRRALEKTAAVLADEFGSDPATWAWGRIHTLDQQSLLRSPRYSEGPFATGGGFQTLDMADPTYGAGGTDQEMRHQAGGSIRLIYALGQDGVSAQFELPGGQVHHRDSAFYNSGLQAWLRQEPTALAFDPADVESRAVETIVIPPSSEGVRTD